MNLYQNYRQSRNMNNKYSGLSGSNNQLENYILCVLWRNTNSERIILDPKAFDATIEAAAVDLAHRIQKYFP